MTARTFSIPKLMQKYQMQQCARYFMTNDGLGEFEYTDNSVLELSQVVYIWTLADEIIRIGSSKGTLRGRMKQHKTWVNDRLTRTENRAGKPYSEKEKLEAAEWRQRIIDTRKPALLWARLGIVAKTPSGTVNTYQSEETHLLAKHKPPLNNSWFR